MGYIHKMEYYSATERNAHWEFPGGPVVRTPILLPGVLGSIPNQGIKVLQAVWESQKKKKKKRGMKHLHLLQHG